MKYIVVDDEKPKTCADCPLFQYNLNRKELRCVLGTQYENYKCPMTICKTIFQRKETL